MLGCAVARLPMLEPCAIFIFAHASPCTICRLLQGDVGSGKTMVALLAMLATAAAGRRAGGKWEGSAYSCEPMQNMGVGLLLAIRT